MKRYFFVFLVGFFFALFVTEASATEVKVGGEIRVRGESVGSDGPGTKGMVLQRTRINVDAQVNETVKAYIQVQDSRSWGRDGTTNGTGTSGDETTTIGATGGTVKVDNRADIKQAYFQLDKIIDQPLSVRVGRQVMAYGEHRLIGGFEWSNNARSFDAVKLMYNAETFGVDLWSARIYETSTTSSDSDFNGIYATYKGIPSNTVDLYYLQDTVPKSAVSGSPNDANDANKGRDVSTYGLRLNGKLADMDYTGEIALQGGTRTNTGTEVKQEASAYAVKAGYTIPSVMGLRVGAEYDSATGDDSGTADKKEDFQNLYPTNHYLYGFTDDISWSNMKAWAVVASLKPVEGLWLGAEYWNYTAAKVASGVSDNLGNEINLMARYPLMDAVKLEATWVRRTAGEGGGKDYYGNSLAKDKISDFIYLSANVVF
ncbi:MAG: alginate export family protein [Nitrospinae bacterium]|nr:alginate export family protein [Nitrospinota bacterium]